MKVFRGIPNIKGPSVLMFGIFDGVHLAHKKIITNALEQADRENSPAVLCSFYKRPSEVLRSQAPNLLTSEAQKLAVLSKLGLDACCITKFNEEFSKIPAEQWLEYICLNLKPTHIYIGYNFNFGYLGKGDRNMLFENEKKYGYKLHVLENMMLKDISISSTIIRKNILEGNLDLANKLLGRNFILPLKIEKDYDDKYLFNKPSRMILPHIGTYNVELEYYKDGNKFISNTYLHINNEIKILKKDLHGLVDLYDNCSVKFLSKQD